MILHTCEAWLPEVSELGDVRAASQPPGDEATPTIRAATDRRSVALMRVTLGSLRSRDQWKASGEVSYPHLGRGDPVGLVGRAYAGAASCVACVPAMYAGPVGRRGLVPPRLATRQRVAALFWQSSCPAPERPTCPVWPPTLRTSYIVNGEPPVEIRPVLARVGRRLGLTVVGQQVHPSNVALSDRAASTTTESELRRL
jgi:hypothetical protein